MESKHLNAFAEAEFAILAFTKDPLSGPGAASWRGTERVDMIKSRHKEIMLIIANAEVEEYTLVGVLGNSIVVSYFAHA